MSPYGASWEKAWRYVGSPSQLARIDRFVEDDGPARGARRLRLVNGGGLEIELHPDRALDIGQVTQHGVPIAWMAGSGIESPAFYDPQGAGWLRSFGGGFMTTCGLDTFGAPSQDEGVAFGQHGRISAVPATMHRIDIDQQRITVEGLIRQSAHLGENLTLRRRIETVLGSSSFTVTDVVTNESSVPEPHMLMYHVNLGWPLLSPDTTLSVPSMSVAARDPRSEARLDRWRVFEEPVPGRDDHVYLHALDANANGWSVSRLENLTLGMYLEVEQRRDQLPWLCQWTMLTEDAYVVGLEPVNTPTMVGRADARQRGVLPILQPHEKREYTLNFRLGRSGD